MAGEATFYDATYQHAGAQCSSTNEGRYVSIAENLLTHPAHPLDGLVDKGDPVVCNTQNLVGVAMGSAVYSDDFVVIDTEGIWWLMVEAGKQGMGDIHVGAMLFIDATTGVVSDDFMATPFGHALGPVDGGHTTLIAVKVHAFQWLIPWWWNP